MWGLIKKFAKHPCVGRGLGDHCTSCGLQLHSRSPPSPLNTLPPDRCSGRLPPFLEERKLTTLVSLLWFEQFCTWETTRMICSKTPLNASFLILPFRFFLLFSIETYATTRPMQQTLLRFQLGHARWPPISNVQLNCRDRCAR